MKGLKWGLAALAGLVLVACAPSDKDPAADAPALEDRAAAAAPEETVPPASTLQDAGAMCGGIAGLQCAEGLYCHMEPGVCGSVADASGECREIPQICTREYMPVRGCDGKKYPNRCEANAGGTSVAGPWVESEESTGE